MQCLDTAWPPRARKPRSGRKVGAGAAGDNALILGAIIAGGQARRFGSDKAAAMLDGRALIDHAIEAITRFVDKVVVVGRDWPGYATLPDVPRPGLGPLGGIAAALHYSEKRGFHHVLTMACDMPLLPEGLLAKLVANYPSFCSDAPILGYWPAAESNRLLAYLCSPAKPGVQSGLLPSRENKDGRLSIRRWAQSIGATPVPSPDLPNINTPADLLAL